MKYAVVIGGTSGLGLEIAKQLSENYEVYITGRKDPKVENLKFKEFELAQGSQLPAEATKLADWLENIDVLVYAAGFFQEGTITDLSEFDIERMLDVGGRGMIYIMREILKKQGKLDELITITSTSQWTPRKFEPIYNFVKAGVGHMSNGLAEDGRIGKVLVAGPAGMATNFWTSEQLEEKKDDGLLDPVWVAEEIMKLRSGNYRYKYARILRDPPRVEQVEERT